MRKKERFGKVMEYFRSEMPQASSELVFSGPYQLLVAVMLSAQCTDKRVNMVTPALFAAFPDPQSLSAAPLPQILSLVRSVSYPNSKALHLKQMASMLVERFDSCVPSGIEDLMSLPGVGRKTANVVASVIWSAPVIAVDTHVLRVSRRLGLSDGTTPEAVEKDLEAYIAEDVRPLAHHWLLLHGRYVCTARSPRCRECGLSAFCRHFRTVSE